MTDTDNPTDDSDYPGIEGGAQWVPTDTKAGKVSKLPLLTGSTPTSATVTGWKTEQVRDALCTLTFGGNMVIGGRIGANLAMTKDEANAVAEPLTNIINRRPLLKRAASEGGDPVDVVLVALATVPYGTRLFGEAVETRRRDAERRLREAEAERAAIENAAPEYQPSAFEVGS